MDERELQEAAVRMQRLQPAPEGWAWQAGPVVGVPDWFQLRLQSPTEREGRGAPHMFLGPQDTILRLSSNPLIHDFGVVGAVLAQKGGLGWDAEQLTAEIVRRTSGRERA